MKNLMKACVLSVTMLVLMCGVAGADDFHPQGTLIVPNMVYIWQSSYGYTYQWIVLTNITNESVECRVRFYDHNGQDRTSLGNVLTGTPSGNGLWETVAMNSGDFEIPAHNTRMFALAKSGTRNAIIGHALIEWQSNDPLLRKALVGGLQTQQQNGLESIGRSSSFLNNGQPF